MQFATQESAFAHVADTGPTGPFHRNIAGLGQLKQTLERVVPRHSQAAPSKRNDRSVSARLNREMRVPRLGFHYTRLNGLRRAEYLPMYRVLRNTQRNQAAIHVLEKSCGTA